MYTAVDRACSCKGSTMSYLLVTSVLKSAFFLPSLIGSIISLVPLCLQNGRRMRDE